MSYANAADLHNQRYREANTKKIGVRFYPADMYLYDYIKSQPQGYIKRLVRADMVAHGVEVPEVPE